MEPDENNAPAPAPRSNIKPKDAHLEWMVGEEELNSIGIFSDEDD